MSRISSAAANTLLLEQIFRTQGRVLERELQVATEKKSQDYQGIAADSRRLVNLENERSLLQRYISNNEQLDIRLQIEETATEGIRKVIQGFRNEVVNFGSGEMRDKEKVDFLQSRAIEAIKSLNFLLNSEVDGRYLFGGARLTEQPVDIGVSSLTSFQSTFDGARVTVPTTRDAQLEDFSFSANPADADATWLQFERVNAGSGLSRVTAVGDTFKNVTVGSTITIAGTASNNGTYTVSAVDTTNGLFLDLATEHIPSAAAVTEGGTLTYRDPTDFTKNIIIADSFTSTVARDTLAYTDNALDSLAVGTKFTVTGTTNLNSSYTVSSINTATNTITIATTRLTDEGATTDQAGTISATSYYKGDGLTRTHRVDDDHSFSLDVSAEHAGFEKAIRAMKLIAQGAYGTEGGLDHNTNRASEAIYLLNSSLQRTVAGTPPFGTELSGNIEQVQIDTGFKRVLIDNTNKLHKDFIGFFEGSISNLENADATETITKMLDDQRALEVSFQVFSRIRQLSLSNFL
jgi:flagellar hook-associated protein 3 FlgL